MIRVLKNIEQISEEIADLIQNTIRPKSSESIHIALSGGNTPKAIFQYLEQHYSKKLYDKRVHFWWGDDRCVPPNHPDSNYYWAHKLWLEPMGVLPENIHRVYGENIPQDEAIRYASEIESSVAKKNDIPCFDIVFLGLGDDGHTASIFPNQMHLLQSDKLCDVAKNPQSGQTRISFTGVLINNANHIVFIATGANKAQKVKEVLLDKNLDLPATHIEAKHGEIVWIIDTPAAQYLKK